MLLITIKAGPGPITEIVHTHHMGAETSVPVPPFDAKGCRYDQSTYAGRLNHFKEMTDPRTLLVGDEQLLKVCAVPGLFQEHAQYRCAHAPIQTTRSSARTRTHARTGTHTTTHPHPRIHAGTGAA